MIKSHFPTQPSMVQPYNNVTQSSAPVTQPLVPLKRPLVPATQPLVPLAKPSVPMTQSPVPVTQPLVPVTHPTSVLQFTDPVTLAVVSVACPLSSRFQLSTTASQFSP